MKQKEKANHDSPSQGSPDAGPKGSGMSDQLIQSDPDVMLGKPVVHGTRITVELILRKLSRGESIEQILESHPRLTREAVLAALGDAAEAMKHETAHAVDGQKPA